MKLLSAAVIRRCLIADPGKVIITADFNQVELRIAAALAREPALMEAAHRNESLLKIAAVKLFGENYNPDQYRYTKNATYGWLYGGGPKTLSDQAGIPFATASALVKEYQETFPALTAYKRRMQNQILKDALTSNEFRVYQMLRGRMYHYRYETKEGRAQRAALANEIDRLFYGKVGFVTTPFGRRLPVDARKAYSVVNYLIQSSAADIMKQALLRVMANPVLEPTVLLPIHDEILGQAPKARASNYAAAYGRLMSTEFEGVPITASGKVYGKSWGHGYR